MIIKFSTNCDSFSKFSLPVPNVPRFDFFGSLVSDALIIGVVSFAVALSLGKTFAKKHGYQVSANQEFVALGMFKFYDLLSSNLTLYF